MLVQEFPKASQEKHLLRGFSIFRCDLFFRYAQLIFLNAQQM
jgi:hypothetical protein